MRACRLTTFAAVGVIVSLARAQDSPPAIIEAVAQVGDPAPGIPGFTLGWCGKPVIDGTGNVMFFAVLDGPEEHAGNDTAIFYGLPGDLQKLIWASEPAPDMPEGVVISSLWYAGENYAEDTGWIAFAAFISGPDIEPGFNDRVLYVGPPDDLCKAMQAGEQAIGCEPGAYPGSEWFGGRLSDNGTLMAGSELGGTGIWGDQAIWIGTRDNLELVYRKNMQVPGLPEGVHFQSGNDFVHNDAGEIAFRAGLDGPGITTQNDKGQWLGGPGTLAAIIREGDPVPSIPGAVFSIAPSGSTTNINTPGNTAECALIQGEGVTEDNDRVYLHYVDEELCLIGREGDAAPGAGESVYIEYYNGCRINNRGEILYQAKLAGLGISEDNQAAVYFGPPGAGRLALRDQDPAPTFPPETSLSAVGYVPGLVAMNDLGDIVTPTQIEGPGVTEDDKVVLWLWHRILKRWIPLLRSAMTIADRTVYAADQGDFGYGYCSATAGADGKYQSFNDLAMLAIRLEFTDGTEGIFRISPPVFGDADQDGDVDSADWLAMQSCCTDSTLVPGCGVFDLDADGDVDLVDQAMFQELYQGD